MASLILLFSVGFAIFLRTQHLPQLQGKYLLGIDSYQMFRQARQVVEIGKLPTVDPMRYSPLGKDNSYSLTTTSYLIAYSYHLIHFFWPQVTIEQVAIWYPVLLFVISIPIFFFSGRSLFGSSTASLASIAFATAPPLIYHTSAGFADRDALTLFLFLTAFFLYLQAQLAQNTPRQLVLSFSAGVTLGLVGLTWPGVGFLITLIVLTNWLALLLSHYDIKRCLLYVVWFLPIALTIAIFTPRYRNLTDPFAVLALYFPLIFLIFATSWLLLQQHGISYIRENHFLSCLTSPLVFSGVYLFLLFIIGCLVVGPSIVLDQILSFQRELLNPLGLPLMRSVAELQPPAWRDWWGSFGVFLLFAYIGAGLILMKIISTFKEQAKWLIIFFSVMLLVLTLIPLNAKDFHDSPLFLRLMPSLATILFIFTSFWFYWKCYSQIKLAAGQNSGQIHSLLFCFCWFLGSFLATRAASRFALFFTPIALLTGSFCILEIGRLIIPKNLHKTAFQSLALALIAWGVVIIRPSLLSFLLKFVHPSKGLIYLAFWGYIVLSALAISILLYRSTFQLISATSTHRFGRAIGWLALCFIIFLAFGSIGGVPGLLQNSYSLAQYISLSITPAWMEALTWMSTYTNLDSVIAAWWDYGAWINELGGRTTIIDEDHQFPNWISWMAREVFCTPSEHNALEFLKTRQATHLLLTFEEIQKLWHISSLGSNSDLDRQSLVIPLTVNSIQVTPNQNTAQLNFAPIDIPVEQEPILVGLLDNKKRIATIQLTTFLKIQDEKLVLQKLQATFPDKPSFSLKRGMINHQNYSFPNTQSLSCVWLNLPAIKTIRDIKTKAMHLQAFYIPEKAQKHLIVQLFLFNEKLSHFERVYPLLNFSTAPIKVWRLSYPETVSLQPKYLNLE